MVVLVIQGAVLLSVAVLCWQSNIVLKKKDMDILLRCPLWKSLTANSLFFAGAQPSALMAWHFILPADIPWWV